MAGSLMAPLQALAPAPTPPKVAAKAKAKRFSSD